MQFAPNAFAIVPCVGFVKLLAPATKFSSAMTGVDRVYASVNESVAAFCTHASQAPE